MKLSLDKTIYSGLLATVVFTALAHGTVEPWSVAIFELMVIVLLLLWTTKAVMEKSLTISLPRAALPLACLVGFALVQSLSLTSADGTRRSLSMDVEATRSAFLVLVLLFVAHLIGINFLKDGRRLRSFANFIATYGLAMAVFALVQYFTWNGKFYWFRPNTEGVSPFGPFVNHNHYAGYIELLMPIPIALAATRAVRGEARLFHGFAALVMGISAIVSLSRGGMIAVTAELLFLALVSIRASRGAEEVKGDHSSVKLRFPFLSPRHLAVPVFILAIGAGVVWIGAEPVFNRVARDHVAAGSGRPQETFFTSRGWIWEDTLSLVVANPITGVGLGAYKTAFPIYSRSDGSLEVGQAHNDYLQVLADFGLIGAGLLAWFLVVASRAISRSIRSRDPFLASLALGGSAGIFGMLVHSFFDFNLQLPSNALLFLILLGIVCQLGEAGGEEVSRGDAETRRRGDMGTVRSTSVCTCFALLALVIATAIANASGSGSQQRSNPPAQSGQSSVPPIESRSSDASGISGTLILSDQDYRIGPADGIEILVEDAPELTGIYRVSSAGTIHLTFLGRVVAAGKTPDELGELITEGLRGRYLKNPKVTVIVRESTSSSFYMLGAVRKPGVYQVQGRPSMLRLLTLSGGLAENHGTTAFVIRELKPGPQASAGQSTQNISAPGIDGENSSAQQANGTDGARYELITVNVNGLLRGRFEQNMMLEPGDIVNIPPTDVFFVAGEVKSPGSFPLKEGTTLRQAISLAQGTTFKASPGRGIIFREEPGSGRREEIPVNIAAVMGGSKQDVPLRANDILIVPGSALKAVGLPMLQAFGFLAVTRMVLR